MTRMFLNWGLSALALLIVANVVPGFYVNGFIAALIAAVAVGFVNATLGAALKILTFPFTLVTLGIFWFVVNALMLKLTAAVVPGFAISSFGAAFFGAIVLSVVNLIFRMLKRRLWKEEEE